MQRAAAACKGAPAFAAERAGNDPSRSLGGESGGERKGSGELQRTGSEPRWAVSPQPRLLVPRSRSPSPSRKRTALTQVTASVLRCGGVGGALLTLPDYPHQFMVLKTWVIPLLFPTLASARVPFRSTKSKTASFTGLKLAPCCAVGGGRREGVSSPEVCSGRRRRRCSGPCSVLLPPSPPHPPTPLPRLRPTHPNLFLPTSLPPTRIFLSYPSPRPGSVPVGPALILL